MEAERALSRSFDGRQLLLQKLDPLLLEVYNVVEAKVSGQSVDAIATLANLFVNDVDGVVLRGCMKATPQLLPSIVGRLREGVDLACTYICLTNCWKQSEEHRKYLLDLDIFDGLVDSLIFDRFTIQGINTMRIMIEEGEEKVIDNIINNTELANRVEKLFFRLCDEEQKNEKLVLAARKFLLASSLLLDIAEKKNNRLNDVVKICMASRMSNAEELLDFLCEYVSPKESYVRVFIQANELWEFLHSVLFQGQNCSTNDPKVKRAAEFLSVATRQVGDDQVFKIFSLGIDRLLVRLVEKASDQIPADPQLRVRDQSQVLDHAITRLASLTTLLQLSTTEPRSRHLVEGNVHQIAARIVYEYADYDLEATRIASTLLKNLALADSHAVVELGNLTQIVSKLVKSPDQHTSFIVAGIFRIVSHRCGRTDIHDWSKLSSDKTSLLEILSLDLTKVHPHTRVELARALASLMTEFSEFGANAPALETAQAVKFVAFLLQAPQRELIQEGLKALLGLTGSFIAAIPSMDVEIVPGLLLHTRIKELGEEHRDSLETSSVAIAKSCEELISKMNCA